MKKSTVFIISLVFTPFLFVKPFKIDNLLQGVSLKCDIHILRDGSEDMQFTSKYIWPTTIIHIPTYYTELSREYQPYKYALDIWQFRMPTPTCTINLLVLPNLAVTQYYSRFDSPAKLFRWVHNTATKQRLKYWYTEWVQPYLPGLYTLLMVTDKTIFLPEYGHDFSANDDLIIHNFAVVLISESTLFCVPSKWQDLVLANMNCAIKSKRITVLQSIDQNWLPCSFLFSYTSPDPTETDVFDRFSTKSIQNALYYELIENRGNVTLCTYTTRKYIPTPWCGPYQTWESFPRIDRTEFSGWKYNPIFLHFHGYDFLTCYSYKFLSFEFYLTPFEPNLWLGLGIFMSLIVVMLSIYVKIEYSASSFSPWLFILASLFEETTFIPKALEKKTFFRLVLGFWSLMSIFLTNCYTSLMMTGLNSPLPGVKINSWRDLICGPVQKIDSNLTSWMENNKVSQYWSQIEDILEDETSSKRLENPDESTKCFRLLSQLTLEYEYSPRFPNNQFCYTMLSWYGLIRSGIEDSESYFTETYGRNLELLFLRPGHARETKNLTKLRRENSNKILTAVEYDAENEKEIASCSKSAFFCTFSKN
jgi:hypothetical protein